MGKKRHYEYKFRSNHPLIKGEIAYINNNKRTRSDKKKYSNSSKYLDEVLFEMADEYKYGEIDREKACEIDERCFMMPKWDSRVAQSGSTCA